MSVLPFRKKELPFRKKESDMPVSESRDIRIGNFKILIVPKTCPVTAQHIEWSGDNTHACYIYWVNPIEEFQVYTHGVLANRQHRSEYRAFKYAMEDLRKMQYRSAVLCNNVAGQINFLRRQRAKHLAMSDRYMEAHFRDRSDMDYIYSIRNKEKASLIDQEIERLQSL